MKNPEPMKPGDIRTHGGVTLRAQSAVTHGHLCTGCYFNGSPWRACMIVHSVFGSCIQEKAIVFKDITEETRDSMLAEAKTQRMPRVAITKPEEENPSHGS